MPFQTRRQLEGHIGSHPNCASGARIVPIKAATNNSEHHKSTARRASATTTNPNQSGSDNAHANSGSYQFDLDQNSSEDSDDTDPFAMYDNETKNGGIVDQVPEDEVVLDYNDDDDDEDGLMGVDDIQEEKEEEDRGPDIPADKNEFNPRSIESWGPAYLQSLAGNNTNFDPTVQGYHLDKPDEMTSEVKSDVELLKILQGHDLTLLPRIRTWRSNSEYKYKHKMDPISYPKNTRVQTNWRSSLMDESW